MNLLKHKLLALGLLSLLLTPVFAPITGNVSAQEGALGDTGKVMDKNDCDKANYQNLSPENCGIVKIVTVVTNVLGGLAGLVIVASMVYGGIQYSMAGADPNKVQLAKHRLIISLTALLLLIFGYAFLQWVVPGGVL